MRIPWRPAVVLILTLVLWVYGWPVFDEWSTPVEDAKVTFKSDYSKVQELPLCLRFGLWCSLPGHAGWDYKGDANGAVLKQVRTGVVMRAFVQGDEVCFQVALSKRSCGTANLGWVARISFKVKGKVEVIEMGWTPGTMAPIWRALNNLPKP